MKFARVEVETTPGLAGLRCVVSDESKSRNCIRLLSKQANLLHSQLIRSISETPDSVATQTPRYHGGKPHYPIPVSFFNSVSVLSAVTMGECSYSLVNSACTSRSTARQIEYNRQANAK